MLFNLVLVIVVLIVEYLIYTVVKNVMRKRITNSQQRSLIHKVLFIFYIVIAIFSVSIVLGYNVENMWIGIGSVLGLVAIGFVAVWSLLGNIFAAFILFTTRPFTIGSKIIMVESKIEGEVFEITLFFTVLRNKDNLYHIPNTMFFQKEFVHVVKLK